MKARDFIRRLQGFNPTLVRLRQFPHEADDFFHFLFQSHAGSIEAISPPPRLRVISEVSIPRWFD